MHDTSVTPMRKALGVTACRSSRVYVNVGQQQQQGTAWVCRRAGCVVYFGRFSNSAYKMCHLHYGSRFPPFQRPETRKIQGFSSMAAGKRSIHRQIRRFSWICGCPPISASPTEYLGLIFRYQLLHIKCAIYTRPRVDLGVLLISPFQRLRWPETRRIQGVFEDGCWNKDLWVSTNFGVSNGKLGLDFLSENSTYKMWHLH